MMFLGLNVGISGLGLSTFSSATHGWPSGSHCAAGKTRHPSFTRRCPHEALGELSMSGLSSTAEATQGNKDVEADPRRHRLTTRQRSLHRKHQALPKAYVFPRQSCQLRAMSPNDLMLRPPLGKVCLGNRYRGSASTSSSSSPLPLPPPVAPPPSPALPPRTVAAHPLA